MAIRQKLLATSRAFTDAHSELNLDAVMALCAPECKHRSGPVTLKIPTQNNEEYEAHQIQYFKLFYTYNLEYVDTIIDEEARKVIFFVISRATYAAGSYENEYIITVTMTEDGEKIVDSYVFVDSTIMISTLAKVNEIIGTSASM